MERIDLGDGVFFEGEIKCRPIMLRDLVELHNQICQSYQFLHTCDMTVQEFLSPIIDIACDYLSDLCRDQFEFENCDADFDSYYCGVYYPEK